jgi:hypothetical protein
LFQRDEPFEFAVDHDLAQSHFLLFREKQEVAGQDGLGDHGHIIFEEITATDPITGSTIATVNVVEIQGNRVFSLTERANNIQVHAKSPSDESRIGVVGNVIIINHKGEILNS